MGIHCRKPYQVLMKLSIHLHCLGILLLGIRKNVNLCNTTQLTLKEQGLELCGSTYKKILFLIINTIILVEKTMATQSSTLAWKIPWMEEPGKLQSMGSLGVGHDWGTSLSIFTLLHWRRKWQPISVFLPGGSQGRGSLVGCRLWVHTESDTNEAT